MSVKKSLALFSLALAITSSEASGILPFFNSNADRLNMMNPAFYGKMTRDYNLLELSLQSGFLRSADASMFSERRHRLNSFPVFNQTEYNNPARSTGSYFRNKPNYHVLNLNGLSYLDIHKKYMFGYGGGFIIENVDEKVIGRHFNAGASLINCREQVKWALGLNLKLDHYRANDVHFDSLYGPEAFDIRSTIFNMDIGIRLSNKDESFNIGVGVDNVLAGFAGIEYERVGPQRPYNYSLPYRPVAHFTYNHLITLGDVTALHQNLYVATLADGSWQDKSYVQYNLKFRILTSYYYEGFIELGVNANSNKGLGPSFTYRGNKFDLHYSKTLFWENGHKLGSAGKLHEIGLKIFVKSDEASSGLRKFRPLVNPVF